MKKIAPYALDAHDMDYLDTHLVRLCKISLLTE
jgi:hypothetical protein